MYIQNYIAQLCKMSNNIDITSILPQISQKHLIAHYTSPNAFRSIMENARLRFTNRAYLNDKSEGSYILDLCVNKADEFLRDYPECVEEFCSSCKQAKANLHSGIFQVFQCSFSVDIDNLCLWNYYTGGDNIQGYNLQFNAAELQKELIIHKKSNNSILHFRMGKVVYKEKKQKELIEKIIAPFMKFYTERNTDSPDAWRETLYVMIPKLVLLGQFMKAPCFESESEFRITTEHALNEQGGLLLPIDEKSKNATGGDTPYSVDYFVRNGVIVPYIDVDFKPHTLKAIGLSPTLESTQAKYGAYAISKKHFNKTITSLDQIVESKIPVRY